MWNESEGWKWVRSYDIRIAEEITECMLDVDCWIVKAGGRICQLSNLPCSDAIRHVSFCQGPEVPEHLGEGGRYGGHRGLWAGGQAQRRHRTAGHTTQHQVGHLITLLYNRWSFIVLTATDMPDSVQIFCFVSSPGFSLWCRKLKVFLSNIHYT